MKKFRILILELCVAIIIFCSLTFIKFVFPKTFNGITELYKIYLCTETDVSTVLGGQ